MYADITFRLTSFIKWSSCTFVTFPFAGTEIYNVHNAVVGRKDGLQLIVWLLI